MTTTEIQTVDEQQHDKMARVLNSVGPMVKETKRLVRQIAEYGQEINEPALTEAAQTIGKNISTLREVAAQVGSLAAATHGALKATVEARDAVLGELSQITSAIEKFDTKHPLLEGFAARVEEEVNEAAEWDWEDEQFRASQNLQNYFGTPPLVAVAQAEQLKELFFGEYAWTDEQAALIAQLVGTLEIPDWIEMPGGDVDD